MQGGLPADAVTMRDVLPRKLCMKTVLLAACALVGFANYAHAGQIGLKDFESLFKQSIGEAVKLKAPVERFSEEAEIGWERTFLEGEMAVKIVVFLVPGTTFAVKHLCFGASNKLPLSMECTSNLGQAWTETKNAAGQWVQGSVVDLPWRRDLADLAFD
jgi:hypothetical protein